MAISALLAESTSDPRNCANSCLGRRLADTGDHNAARLAELLQAGGDVDAVAEEVVVLHPDVAEIDAGAEDDSADRHLVVASSSWWACSSGNLPPPAPRVDCLEAAGITAERDA